MEEVYRETDVSLNDISFYDELNELRSKLKDHRESVELPKRLFLGELDFYTDLAEKVFSSAFKNLINDGLTTSWDTLISWIWVFKTEGSIDVCNSLGLAKFTKNTFNRDLFLRFIKYDHLAISDLSIALNYDVTTKNMYDKLYLQNTLLKKNVESLILKVKNIDYINVTNDIALLWTKWYGYYQTIILTVRNNALKREKNDLDEIYKTAAIESGVHLILLFVTCFLIFPLIHFSSRKTVLSMHSMTISISRNQRELKAQKRKTEILLREMLPRSVAYKFLKGEEVEPQYFDNVTVLFSDIADFNQVTSRSAPLQIVEFLNVIYNIIDDCVSKFDVYKVETIGAVYMVVSGLPMANGDRHASEISKLALAMLRKTSDIDMDVVNGKRLLLRIGVHTGSCVAGVVGNKMPRYCLFGDTINTASRMQSNGQR